MKQLREDDDRRMEELWIDDCEFNENNWSVMIEIILNIKIVDLWSMEMEREQWERLADVIQQRWGQIKSKKLDLLACNIGEQFVERVRRFNYL